MILNRLKWCYILTFFLLHQCSLQIWSLQQAWKQKTNKKKTTQGAYPEYGTYIDINALLKTSERIGLITSQQFISPNQINKPYLLGFWQIVASAYDRYFPIILSWCSHLRRIHQALQDYCKISQWCNKENKTVYRFDRRLERSFYINGQSSVHYSNYGKKHFLLSSSFRKKSTSEYFCG